MQTTARLTEPSVSPVSARTYCVAPPQVEEVWKQIGHLIATAYTHPSDETFEQTQADVLNGKALLWVAVQRGDFIAAAVTKIWQTNKKILSVLACAGEGDDWPGMLKPIEDYAEREGCDAVRLEGRHGWQRVFPEYHQPWIVLEKRIKNAGRRNQ